MDRINKKLGIGILKILIWLVRWHFALTFDELEGQKIPNSRENAIVPNDVVVPEWLKVVVA